MKILQRDVESFLNNMRNNSKIEFIDENNDLVKSKISDVLRKAEKIGIKSNRTLALFRNVYATVNVANRNKCILPREVVEANLDTLKFTPIDINHVREDVVGFYFDVEMEGEDIVSYGAFFVDNFSTEWEEAKKGFEDGYLATSFEIYCPREKRKYKENGDYELTEIYFAGGAILTSDVSPAFPNAKFLDIARKNSKVKNKDLIFSSIKPEEIITSNIIESNFNCECIKCGFKMSSEEHCNTLKCSKCGGQMRRADRPGTGDPQNRLKNSLFEEVKLPKKLELKEIENEEGYQIGDIVLESGKVLKKIIILNSSILLLDKNLKEMEEIKTGKIKEIIIYKGGQNKMNWEDIRKLLDQGGKESIITKLNEAKFTDEEFDKVAENIIAEVEKEKLAEGKVRAEMDEKKFAVNIKIAKKEGEGVIKLFPIESKEEVEAAFLRFNDEKVQATLNLLGVNLWEIAKTRFVATLESEIKTKLDTAEAEIKTLKEAAEKTDKELTEAKTKIDELEANLKDKEKEVADEKKKVQFFKENAKKIEATRQDLGDFAKDLTDEDLLNEDKVTIAKLQRDNTFLKTGVKTKVELEQSSEIGGEINSKDVLKRILNARAKKLK